MADEPRNVIDAINRADDQNTSFNVFRGKKNQRPYRGKMKEQAGQFMGLSTSGELVDIRIVKGVLGGTHFEIHENGRWVTVPESTFQTLAANYSKIVEGFDGNNDEALSTLRGLPQETRRELVTGALSTKQLKSMQKARERRMDEEAEAYKKENYVEGQPKADQEEASSKKTDIVEQLKKEPSFNEKIFDVQNKLYGLGYNLDPRKRWPNEGRDGILGDDTRAAIRKFQQDYSLPVTGNLTGPTINILKRQTMKSEDLR